jgi:hypothetical protein
VRIEQRANSEYPLTLTADAIAKTETTTVTSSISIRIERLMAENGRMRVTDALRYGGYSNFLTALRALPPIGTIELAKRKVELRYAHERPEGTGRRLILVADRPLFLLGGDPAKSRAGYELTIVELQLEADGGVTGTMAGAARVKPAGDGDIVLDDYAEARAQLTARLIRP